VVASKLPHKVFAPDVLMLDTFCAAAPVSKRGVPVTLWAGVALIGVLKGRIHLALVALVLVPNPTRPLLTPVNL
jgi:hypothetical protein